jgi:FkbM family methyltransferase
MIKNFIINRPAFLLSEKNYFRYIIFLSNILFWLGLSEKLKSKKVYLDSIQKELWEVKGNSFLIRIQSQYRVSRFLKGFIHSGKRQWIRYGINDLVGLQKPDVLIDLGANISEVSIYAHTLGVRKIIAIEPDPIALECLKFNLRQTSVDIEGIAIGNITGNVTFYSQSHSADSSLFKPEGEATEILVGSMTLNDFCSERDLHGSILLKMDAEGFEPEILESGISALEKIKYVTVDAGAERGNQSTVEDVIRILSQANFDDIKVSSNLIVTAKRN